MQALCARLSVHTAPARVGGLWIFPLYSWYSAEWDREPDVPGSMPISKVGPPRWEAPPPARAATQAVYQQGRPTPRAACLHVRVAGSPAPPPGCGLYVPGLSPVLPLPLPPPLPPLRS